MNSYLNKASRESVGNIRRELRTAFTPEPRGHKWAFIVGCYNSGTTLLSNILGRHPEISALSTEGQFLTEQLVTDYELGLSRMWCQREDLFRLDETSTGPDVARIKRQWAMRLDTSKPVLLEKSPPNSARTRWLARHFEPAYFIVILRNGYAAAEGIRRKARPYHLRDGWPIEQCARQWKRSYEVLDADLSGEERVLWVRYEDLVAQPDDELARVAEFLGIGKFPALDRAARLRVHEREDPLRDMNLESLARLSPGDVEAISRVAGDWLERFGYVRPTGLSPGKSSTA